MAARPSTPDLTAIRSRLAARAPLIVRPPAAVISHAAVALLLHHDPERGTELLFIERAHRPGDVWSGHVAFPGGRRALHDQDVEATAVRETGEELGVTLGRAVARLDDYDARTGRRPWPLIVSPFVFVLDERPALSPNHEVEDAVWVPLTHLLDAAAVTRHRFLAGPPAVFVPALRYERFVIWGMTHRMLAAFFEAAGLA